MLPVSCRKLTSCLPARKNAETGTIAYSEYAGAQLSIERAIACAPSTLPTGPPSRVEPFAGGTVYLRLETD
ncbi:hypothetical protein MPLA_1150021 [Mesorhizobium sp. ORS 3359]|nr:hypothetical protein MPLA_1150021 [Mesorhizobium sp. ORS 3359]